MFKFYFDLCFLNQPSLYGTFCRPPISSLDQASINLSPVTYDRANHELLRNNRGQSNSYPQSNPRKFARLDTTIGATHLNLFLHSAQWLFRDHQSKYPNSCFSLRCSPETTWFRANRFSAPHLRHLRHWKRTGVQKTVITPLAAHHTSLTPYVLASSRHTKGPSTAETCQRVKCNQNQNWWPLYS